MESNGNIIDVIMGLTMKAIEGVQENLIQGLSDVDSRLTGEICNLGLKCAVLEAVQLRLFSALAETNPLTHAKIVDELATVLGMMKENGHQDLTFADHLRTLTGIKAESKPLLRLVPKRPAPAADDADPQ